MNKALLKLGMLIALSGCKCMDPTGLMCSNDSGGGSSPAPVKPIVADPTTTPDPIATPVETPVSTPTATPTPTPEAVVEVPPTIIVEDKIVNEASQLLVQLVGQDSQGRQLTYACISGCPQGLLISNNQASWTPGYGEAGIYDMVFEVSNGVMSATAQARVTVNHTNRPPVFQDQPSRTVEEGQRALVQNFLTDPDGDAISCSFVGTLPTGASFLNCVFDWTPSISQSGSYPITMRATDGNGGQTDLSLTITVSNTNQAPVLNPIGAKTIAENSNLAFSVSASDFDGDSVTLSASGLPTGATFNASTGAFSWTPTCYQEGSYSATFSVTDGAASAQETVSFTVDHTNCFSPKWYFGESQETSNAAVMMQNDPYDTKSSISMSTIKTWWSSEVYDSNVPDLVLENTNALPNVMNGIVWKQVNLEYVCFTSTPSVTVGNLISYPGWAGWGRQEVTFTFPTNNGQPDQDSHTFLFYAEDKDGSRAYLWFHINRLDWDATNNRGYVRMKKTFQNTLSTPSNAWICPNGLPVLRTW